MSVARTSQPKLASQLGDVVARKEKTPQGGEFVRIEVSARGLFKVAVAVGACFLAIKLWVVALTVLIAMMIVFALEPLVGRLEEHGVKRGFALALIYLALFASFFGFLFVTAPPLIRQSRAIIEHLPEHQQKIVSWINSKPMLRPFTEQVSHTQPAQHLEQLGKYVFGALPRALEYVAYTVTAIFLALYIQIDRDRMRGAMYALIPREYHVRTARIATELETIVGGYIRGQVLTSALMGLFLFTLLTICHVKNAVAIAALGAFGDVIPYVGVLFTILPASLAALSKSAGTAVIVAIACATYQEFENRVIIPKVYGKVLRLPSAAVILALLIGGVLGGVLGSILALPLAATLRMLVEELRVKLPGDDRPIAATVRADRAVEETYAERAAGTSAEEAAAIAVELAEQRQEQPPEEPSDVRPPITSGEDDD